MPADALIGAHFQVSNSARFKVSFVAEVTVNARSIGDAVRQAWPLEATEVTSITRA